MKKLVINERQLDEVLKVDESTMGTGVYFEFGNDPADGLKTSSDAPQKADLNFNTSVVTGDDFANKLCPSHNNFLNGRKDGLPINGVYENNQYLAGEEIAVIDPHNGIEIFRGTESALTNRESELRKSLAQSKDAAREKELFAIVTSLNNARKEKKNINGGKWQHKPGGHKEANNGKAHSKKTPEITYF